jgi:hypothetical protein
MKHLLNNLSSEEKNRILEQHKGGMEISRKNFQKLLSNKLGTVKVLVEQDDEFLKTDWVQTSYVTPLLSNGYSQVTEINLPDGTYKMGGSGYQINIKDSTDKETGYSLIVQGGIRGEWEGDITITSKKPSVSYAGIFFKNVGYVAPEKTQKETKTVTSKISDGIQNVLPEMIQSPAFVGEYSGYVFGGEFNGTYYSWDANGVEGMSGVRGIVNGQIETENNSYLTNVGITDADPIGTWVGFRGGSVKFACYKSNQGSMKCANQQK